MNAGVRASLCIQARVMHALLMREVITRYGRDNLGVLWLVAEPMLFTIGVAALWTAAGMHHGSTLPIIAFAITGYSSVLLWRNCANRCVAAIESNLPLLYHRSVRILDILLARNLLEIVGATASFAILAGLFTAAGSIVGPVNMLQIVAAWMLLAWFGSSLALVLGAASAHSDLVEKLWGPVSYLLFPLSGAAFMADWLPPALREVVMLLPMVHGTEMLREGYFGDAVRTHYSVAYLAVSCLVLTLLGLLLVRTAYRRVVMR